LQHRAYFPEFLSRGRPVTFSLGNVETYPQDFLYLTLIVVDASVGPEHPDFLTVAQHVLIDTGGKAIRIALQPIQKAGQISVFKPAGGCQAAEHRFAYDLLGGISEELFAIMIDKSDFAFGVQAHDDGIDFIHQKFATVLLALFLLIARGRWLVGDCFKGHRSRNQNRSQEIGRNLIQINIRGRILQIEFGATAELVSTEEFRIPYTMEGAVRAFNQQLLDKDIIEEQLIYYTLEKDKKWWRFLDPRTNRSGPFSQDYLISLMEQLI
jgi:hypothetical protein